LGFHIDQTLKFENQIKEASRKAYGNLRALYRHIRYLDGRNRSVLANALVGSHLDFCMALYNGLPKKRMKTLERVRRAMKKFIEGVDKVSVGPAWLSMSQRVQLKIIMITRAILTGKSPSFLRRLVAFQQSSHSLRSVTHCDLIIRRSKKALSNRAFQISAPALWNRLPIEVRNGNHSTATFKELAIQAML
jgi:hypothetical protein